ncbi:DHA2 family efflux MFS transporter permease subunit [Streptomyces sp. 184]|uniref:DHA2 family efflux MFS transporter permease subunit n=1 Tax=Streptomyces sp. 184 TaxID=1827526 RepID=UPI0038912EDB
MLLACGGSFVALLDVTIANLAMPDLGREFPGVSVAGLTWVMTSYAIAFAALLAPLGRLADTLGRRRLYLAGLVVFTFASAGCAAAPSLEVLLVSRAVQGAGAAALIPASLAIILGQVPPTRRGAAIGIWAGSASLAAAVGPSLGGVLVDAFGWRSVFLISVPIGAALIAAIRVVSPHRTGGRTPDLLGSVLLALGIGGVVLGVSQGTDWGWDDTRTLLALVSGVVLLVAAVAQAWRHPNPGLEVTLWRRRGYAMANVVSFFFGFALYPWLLLGVLYLTQVWQYSELRAGLAMTHGAVASALAGILVGRYSARLSARGSVVAGALVLAGTAVWIAVALPDEPAFLALWLPTGLTCGVGIGMISTGVSTAAALSVQPPRFASATGLNITSRQVGGALGLAMLAALLNRGGGGPGTGDFADVYRMCAIASLLTAAAGMGLATSAGKKPPARVVSSDPPATGTTVETAA